MKSRYNIDQNLLMKKISTSSISKNTETTANSTSLIQKTNSSNIQNQCVFCDQLKRTKGRFSPLLSKALFSKYSTSQNYFFTKEINLILQDQRHAIVIGYQEAQVWFNSDEYLKRYYKKDEIYPRIASLLEYYKYHIDAPRFFDIKLSKITQQYFEQKRRLEYLRVQQMLNYVDQSDIKRQKLEQEAAQSQDQSIQILQDLGSSFFKQTYEEMEQFQKQISQPSKTHISKNNKVVISATNSPYQNNYNKNNGNKLNQQIQSQQQKDFPTQKVQINKYFHVKGEREENCQIFIDKRRVSSSLTEIRADLSKLIAKHNQEDKNQYSFYFADINNQINTINKNNKIHSISSFQEPDISQINPSSTVVKYMDNQNINESSKEKTIIVENKKQKKIILNPNLNDFKINQIKPLIVNQPVNNMRKINEPSDYQGQKGARSASSQPISKNDPNHVKDEGAVDQESFQNFLIMKENKVYSEILNTERSGGLGNNLTKEKSLESDTNTVPSATTAAASMSSTNQSKSLQKNQFQITTTNLGQAQTERNLYTHKLQTNPTVNPNPSNDINKEIQRRLNLKSPSKVFLNSQKQSLKHSESTDKIQALNVINLVGSTAVHNGSQTQRIPKRITFQDQTVQFQQHLQQVPAAQNNTTNQPNNFPLARQKKTSIPLTQNNYIENQRKASAKVLDSAPQSELIGVKNDRNDQPHLQHNRVMSLEQLQNFNNAFTNYNFTITTQSGSSTNLDNPNYNNEQTTPNMLYNELGKSGHHRTKSQENIESNHNLLMRNQISASTNNLFSNHNNNDGNHPNINNGYHNVYPHQNHSQSNQFNLESQGDKYLVNSKNKVHIYQRHGHAKMKTQDFEIKGNQSSVMTTIINNNINLYNQSITINKPSYENKIFNNLQNQINQNNRKSSSLIKNIITTNIYPYQANKL